MDKLEDVNPEEWKAKRRINRSNTCSKPLHFRSFISPLPNAQDRFNKEQRGGSWWAVPRKGGARAAVGPHQCSSRPMQQQLAPSRVASLWQTCTCVIVWTFACCWSCPRLCVMWSLPPTYCRSCHFLNKDEYQGRVRRGKKEDWRNLSSLQLPLIMSEEVTL